MSNEPTTRRDRKVHRDFLNVNKLIDHLESLPFTDDPEPAVCRHCGGDLQIAQAVEKRRGKLVLEVRSEVVVCARCNPAVRR